MFGDISKAFGQTFLIACFAPASFLIAANLLLARAGIISASLTAAGAGFGFNDAALIGIIAFLAAGLLFFFGSVIYRLYEGYSWKGCLQYGAAAVVLGPLAHFYGLDPVVSDLALTLGGLLILVGLVQLGFRRLNRRRFESLTSAADALAADARSRPKALRDLIENYPHELDQVLPTRLGNIIRAFEVHPFKLYGIDPISGWYRLIGVIPDGFAKQIAETKMGVTFWINTSFVLALLALELWALDYVTAAAVTRTESLGKLTVVASVLSYLCYRFSFGHGKKWGEYVRSAFDLYRLDLLKQLKIKMPEGPFMLAAEREIWTGVQYATFYVTDPQDKMVMQITEAKPAKKSTPAFECAARALLPPDEEPREL